MKISHFIRFLVSAAAGMSLLFPAFSASAETYMESTPSCTLIGHSSLKIITAEGTVIYIDPSYTGDYSEKADLILVTHEHSDHNKTSLCQRNKDCIIITVKQAIDKSDGSYHTFEYFNVTVEPVPAANRNHPLGQSVGYILTFDGIKLYHAGDTSKLESMAGLAEKNIDYAFFPIDGQYNMDADEAMECSAMIGAAHNTPMHYMNADPSVFAPDGLLLIAYGETVVLTKTPE